MLKKIVSGFSAGVAIALGGGVFLACENRVVGSVLFAVALLCICIKGYSLYTGRICYIADHPTKETVSVLLLGLLGNLLATVACGYLAALALPALKDTALVICEKKLTQTFLETLLRGFFCGVLIYLAVDVYKMGKGVVGIIFCIPVFILSGYEHSIADMYYFATSGIVSWRACGFIFTVILGNTIGGLLLPVLAKIGAKKEAEKPAENNAPAAKANEPATIGGKENG